MLNNKRSILRLFMLTLLFLGVRISNAQDAVGTQNGSGIGMTLFVVFAVALVLILLFRFFKGHGNSSTDEGRKMDEMQEAASPNLVEDSVSGEVNAAIAMALYLYSSEIHDQEDPVITMIRVSRTYSPWSSKIYGLRKLPR